MQGIEGVGERTVECEMKEMVTITARPGSDGVEGDGVSDNVEWKRESVW